MRGRFATCPTDDLWFQGNGRERRRTQWNHRGHVVVVVIMHRDCIVNRHDLPVGSVADLFVDELHVSIAEDGLKSVLMPAGRACVSLVGWTCKGEIAIDAKGRLFGIPNNACLEFIGIVDPPFGIDVFREQQRVLVTVLEIVFADFETGELIVEYSARGDFHQNRHVRQCHAIGLSHVGRVAQ